MTTRYEPVLHALDVEPRVARPGAIVRVLFRARNRGSVPSSPATVVFVLGEGLEPLEPTEIAVAAVAPGEDVVATTTARVAAASGVGGRCRVQAALIVAAPACDGDVVPETARALGTNVCDLTVRSRPVLDGPASGTFVEALDAESVRVRAVVTNEGDGTARGVRIILPVPAGCVRAGVSGARDETAELAALEAGASATVAFTARIVSPSAQIVADAATVECSNAHRLALTARAVVTAQPSIVPPQIVLAPRRRAVDVAVEVRNHGWADARAVPVRIVLPSPLRPAGGEIVVDGVPVPIRPLARLRSGGRTSVRAAQPFAAATCVHSKSAGDDVGVTLDVLARSVARVSLRAIVPIGCPPCTIVAYAAGARVEAVFAPRPVRDVRFSLATAAASVEPGQLVRMVATVVNAGDAEETVRLAFDDVLGVTSDAPVPALTVAPGCVRTTDVVARIPDGAQDGQAVPVTAVVRCDDRDDPSSAARDDDICVPCARAGVSFVVRDRAWLRADDEPQRANGRTCFRIRNGGATTARDVSAVFGDEVVAIAPVQPGGVAEIDVADAFAAFGGVVRIGARDALVIEPVVEEPRNGVEAVLDGPCAVFAGSAFDLTLTARTGDAAGAVVICLPAAPGAQYVPGSTWIDGHPLLDGAGGSPLAGEGLRLHDVPAGTRVRARCSFFVDTARDGETLRPHAVVTADGAAQALAPLAITVHARDTFAVRPVGLPYHVDASALEPSPSERRSPPDAACAPPVTGVDVPHAEVTINAPDAVTFGFALSHERIDQIVRLLSPAATSGLVAHVLALRALFPDGVGLSDGETAAAFDAARLTVDDVFDRLFVKLRIPGFIVACDDIEDAPMRTAVTAAIERAMHAANVPPLRGAFVRVERAHLRAMLDATAGARFGAPAVLRALAAIVPSDSSDDPLIGAALGHYVGALDAALGEYASVPLELFEDALARRTDRALDAARSDLLAALYARHATAAAP